MTDYDTRWSNDDEREWDDGEREGERDWGEDDQPDERDYGW